MIDIDITRFIAEAAPMDYAASVAEIGDMPRNIPDYIVIDWEATADNIRADYSVIDYDGTTYLYR